MSRLTKAEQHLIKHPPTRETWRCSSSRTDEDGAKVPCIGILTGDAPRCWFCGSPKPRRPKLLWLTYVTACTKAGIDPDNPRGVEPRAEDPDSPPQRKPVRVVRRGR